MRTKQEIIDKTKQLIDAAKSDFINRRLQHSFKNCTHNCFVMARNIGKIHYCKLKSDFQEDGSIGKLFICDSDEWSCKCEDFNCKNNEKSSSENFSKIISSPSWCGQAFPKLSALLWVLNDGRSKENDLILDTIHGQEKNEQKKKKRKVSSVIDFLIPWRKT